MTGGIIQLVAYGQEDMFISRDPQVTYFKVVYRRHTNFSIEPVPQLFPDQQINFGRKISTVLAKNGDLIGDITAVITLPQIKKFNNSITQFAWVRQVGFALIKSVEIEINGYIIDRHYGEWLSLFSELVGDLYGDKESGFNKMIGNVPELTNFTYDKDEYTLYVPLRFWFCRSSGLALPIVALQYSDVKINIEFNEASLCYMVSPSHYIQCQADLSNFIQGEYVEQVVNNVVMAGIFNSYDIINQRLYYYKITANKFIGIPSQSVSSSSTQYTIVGKTSEFTTLPKVNSSSIIYSGSKLRNINITNCYLLINYFFLDDEERLRFLQTSHDYLIEQLYYTPQISIDSVNRNIKISSDQPCKLLVWVTQMKYIYNSNDTFNYTDSYIRKNKHDKKYTDNIVGNVVGNNISINETLLLNGRDKISLRSKDYFNYIQPIQHVKHSLRVGANMYSFGLHPLLVQPTGSCNMSQIDTTKIQLQLSNIVTINTQAYFRAYSLCFNVLRISNGLCNVVFTK